MSQFKSDLTGIQQSWKLYFPDLSTAIHFCMSSCHTPDIRMLSTLLSIPVEPMGSTRALVSCSIPKDLWASWFFVALFIPSLVTTYCFDSNDGTKQCIYIWNRTAIKSVPTSFISILTHYFLYKYIVWYHIFISLLSSMFSSTPLIAYIISVVPVQWLSSSIHNMSCITTIQW